MDAIAKTNPTIIVILGATGDLAWRKLIPAIYNLYLDKWMPDDFAVIGVGHTKMTEKELRKHFHEGVDQFSRRGKAKSSEWEHFATCITYHKGEFNVNSTYNVLEKQIKEL